jgi:hypothetical protein
MATISLYASQINQMPGLIADLKRSVTDYKSELESMTRRALSIKRYMPKKAGGSIAL